VITNWLGQNIEVGSYVYRGARAGNTSSYKIGRVTKIKGDKVTVKWGAEAPYSETNYAWFNNQRVDLDIPALWSVGGSGTSNKNTLVVMSEDEYKYAVCRGNAAKDAYEAVRNLKIPVSDARLYFDELFQRYMWEFKG
jgi:hypothetical protein